MKIICLIKPRAHTTYFANAVHSRHPIALAIVERPVDQDPSISPLRRFLSRLRRNGLSAVTAHITCIAKRIFSATPDNRQINDCLTMFFGNDWQQLNPEIPVMVVPSIGAPEVAKRIREMAPNVVLDHGTSLVPNDVIAAAPLTLNLHWGLSPYYRGSYCTKQALLNWDPLNIGVTVHKLTSELDGGDIVGQARATLSATDTPATINVQLTTLGTDIIIRALDILKNNQKLTFHPQDLSQGFISRSRQWHPLLDEYVKMCSIGEMLAHPSRKQILPIVEL